MNKLTKTFLKNLFFTLVAVQFLIPSSIFAEIYQYKDASGVLRFSDSPPPAEFTKNNNDGVKKYSETSKNPLDMVVSILVGDKKITGCFVNRDYILASNKDNLFREAIDNKEKDDTETAIKDILKQIETNDKGCEKILKPIEEAITRINESIEEEISLKTSANNLKNEDQSLRHIAYLEEKKEELKNKYAEEEKICSEDKRELENKKNQLYNRPVSSYRIIITTNGGQKYPGKIEKSLGFDVLIKIENFGHSASVSLNEGDVQNIPLFVIKFDHTGKSNNTRIEGSKAKYSSDTKDRFVIRAKGLTSQDSGSPILDNEGRLVGIVDSVDYENINITVISKKIMHNREFLNF